jgi:hypothetical protein
MRLDGLRVFGPKSADHPSVGQECPACHVAFVEGDYTTLIAIGPGNDPEAQERARQGRPYNAVALEVHATCAGLDPTPPPNLRLVDPTPEERLADTHWDPRKTDRGELNGT